MEPAGRDSSPRLRADNLRDRLYGFFEVRFETSVCATAEERGGKTILRRGSTELLRRRPLGVQS